MDFGGRGSSCRLFFLSQEYKGSSQVSQYLRSTVKSSRCRSIYRHTKRTTFFEIKRLSL